MMIPEPDKTVPEQLKKGSDHHDSSPDENIQNHYRRKSMEIKLAENIRSHRKRLGFTQEQLAERLGITLGAVSKWERGSSTPDLGYLMDLAELFHVSVDALIGFSMRGTDGDTESERIERMLSSSPVDQIAAEYDAALRKFPNHFRIVYGAAEAYRQIGSVYRKDDALKHALELYRHAIDLISQNKDPKITEVIIRDAVAGCYSELKDYKRAIAEYRKNNICGNNDARIGLMLIKNEKKPEEGIEYILQAYISHFIKAGNIFNGYIWYYIAMKDMVRSIQATEWLIRYLYSLKEDQEKRAYPDKIICLYHLILAALQDANGQPAEAEQSLRTAVRIAKAFDADPVYSMENILFTEIWNEPGAFYDSSGPTAVDGLRSTLDEMDIPISAAFREKFEKILRT